MLDREPHRLEQEPLNRQQQQHVEKQDVIAGGFLEPTNYKGAFLGTNWAAGWSSYSRLQAIAACDPITGGTAVPDEATGLAFESASRMTWNDQVTPNPYATRLFDVIRSATPSDFSTATCVETGDGNTTADDATVPAPGAGFYYLVRAVNRCGDGTLGFRSNGVERTGSSCP